MDDIRPNIPAKPTHSLAALKRNRRGHSSAYPFTVRSHISGRNTPGMISPVDG